MAKETNALAVGSDVGGKFDCLCVDQAGTCGEIELFFDGVFLRAQDNRGFVVAMISIVVIWQNRSHGGWNLVKGSLL